MSAADLAFSPTCPVAMTMIMDIVTEHFRLGPLDLISASRSVRVVRPRMIVCYLARELTTMSASQIGRALERDHTTVAHAIRRAQEGLASDRAFAAELDALRAKCAAALPAWKRLAEIDAGDNNRFGVTRRARSLVQKLARKVAEAIERDPIRFIVEMSHVADTIVGVPAARQREASRARH